MRTAGKLPQGEHMKGGGLTDAHFPVMTFRPQQRLSCPSTAPGSATSSSH